MFTYRLRVFSMLAVLLYYSSRFFNSGDGSEESLVEPGLDHR